MEQQTGRTFTQDEVNAIVTERLNRERAKYADYNDLKAKAEQCDAVQAQLDELNRAAARKEMLARVTAATGCPAELLTEETEEAYVAQTRAVAIVGTATEAAINDNSDNNTILKAVGASRNGAVVHEHYRHLKDGRVIKVKSYQRKK